MREYIIHYQTVGSEMAQSVTIRAVTMQDAVNIFRLDNPRCIILSAEGPYDIR
jgi:hypothetical protein